MYGWMQKWLMIIPGLLIFAERLNLLQFGTIDDICEGRKSCRQNDLNNFFTEFELLSGNSNSERPKRQIVNQNSRLLYRFNALNETFLLNLTKFEKSNSILAPTFFAQHLGVNYTFVKNTTNDLFSLFDQNSERDCIYYGEILNSNNNQSVLTYTNSSHTVINLCSGLYGVLELPLGVYFVEPLLKKPVDQRSNPKYIVYRHKPLTFHNRSAAQTNKNKHLASKFLNTNNQHRIKRSISREHHVEVLVVADARLRRYHGSNLENYISTLLSIAGPKITRDAHETLKYFCRWQETLNDKDDDNSLYHHDVAILLTRHDICRSPGKCDTLGLAELGTICDNLRSCAIIEDNGLSAAFTIAHELGHLFNMPHDDEKKCEAYMALEKQNYHIMAPTLEFNAHPWSWSQCSSKTLKQFLEDTQPKCLFDKPIQQKYIHHLVDNPNPGRLFNIDQQCQFVFGPSASLCPYMGTCKLLWCSLTPHHYSGCRTQHMPWADGTYCGHNKWCYHGECVGVSPDQLSARKGDWGEWHEWKSCSRSCGSGVQKSERFCDNPRPSNGGRYCLGERIRVRSCNVKTHECIAVHFASCIAVTFFS
uniref:Peptidase M12B domain-containing protein n=1 Tax=Romanomermis culicivorax TaxID=13658 RepID=A0A915JT00_ROMCU